MLSAFKNHGYSSWVTKKKKSSIQNAINFFGILPISYPGKNRNRLKRKAPT